MANFSSKGKAGTQLSGGDGDDGATEANRRHNKKKRDKKRRGGDGGGGQPCHPSSAQREGPHPEHFKEELEGPCPFHGGRQAPSQGLRDHE